MMNGLRKIFGELRTFLFLSITATISIGAENQAQPTNEQSHDASIVAQYKELLEFPPSSGMIVYRAKLPPDLARVQPPATGLDGSTNFQDYSVRWQSNAFVFRAVRDLAQPNVGLLSASSAWHYDREYWILDNRGAILWVNPDTAKDPEPMDSRPGNHPLNFLRYCKTKLALILNMGVYNIAPGGARWEKDKLHAFYADRNQTIDGQLQCDQGGYPKALTLIYRSGTNAATYVVHYGYGTNRGVSNLPNSIRITEIFGGVEVERENLTIVFADFNSAGRKENYDPRELISTNQLPIFYFTNSAFFSIDKRGRLQRAQLNIPSRVAGTGPTGPFLGLAIIFGFAFLLIGRRYAKTE